MKKIKSLLGVIFALILLLCSGTIVNAQNNQISLLTHEMVGDNSTTRTVRITNRVLDIEDGAFSGLKSLSFVTVDSDNQYFASCSGVLYNKDYTEVICIPQNITSLQLKKTAKSYWSHALDGLSQDKKDKVTAYFGSNSSVSQSNSNQSNTTTQNNSKQNNQSSTNKQNDTPSTNINNNSSNNNTVSNNTNIDFSKYVYTNSDGKVCFNYTGPEVSRIIVPEGVQLITSFVANKTKLNTTTTYIKLPSTLIAMNNWAMYGYTDGDINMYNCLYSCVNLKTVEGGSKYYKGNGSSVLKWNGTICWSSTSRIPYKTFSR